MSINHESYPPECCEGMIKGFNKVSLEMMNVFTIFHTNSFNKCRDISPV